MFKRMLVIECTKKLDGGIHTVQNEAEPYPAELIAAAAEQWAGWTADALQVGAMTDEEIVAEVIRYDATVVGLTVFSYSADRAVNICRLIKAERPTVVTVVGGYHVSVNPEFVLEPSFDFAIIGEGEATISELLSNLETGEKSWHEINGLAFERDVELVLNEKRERIENLDSIPWAKRYEEYLKAAGSNGICYPCPEDMVAMAEVSCSRGCAGKCKFCISNRQWGSKICLRSVESIVAEVTYLKDTFGVNFLYMTDLTFNHSIDRVVEISRAFEAAGLHNPSTESDPDHVKTNVHWTCQCKVGITAEVARIMAAGGCSRVSMGVECLSAEQAKAYCKPERGIADTETSFKALDEAGIINRPNMMFGAPGESQETADATVSGLKSMPCDQYRMSFATPLPGSAWSEELPAEMLDQDLSRFDTEHPVIKMAGIDWEELYALRAMIARKYYNSKEYADHVAEKIARFPHLKRSFESLLCSLKEKGVADITMVVE